MSDRALDLMFLGDIGEFSYQEGDSVELISVDSQTR